jgi:hypothetical protein
VLELLIFMIDFAGVALFAALSAMLPLLAILILWAVVYYGLLTAPFRLAAVTIAAWVVIWIATRVHPRQASARMLGWLRARRRRR